MQEEDVGLPGMLEYVPAAQALHSLEEVAATMDEYVPSGHLMQSPESKAASKFE